MSADERGCAPSAGCRSLSLVTKLRHWALAAHYGGYATCHQENYETRNLPRSGWGARRGAPLRGLVADLPYVCTNGAINFSALRWKMLRRSSSLMREKQMEPAQKWGSNQGWSVPKTILCEPTSLTMRVMMPLTR